MSAAKSKLVLELSSNKSIPLKGENMIKKLAMSTGLSLVSNNFNVSTSESNNFI